MQPTAPEIALHSSSCPSRGVVQALTAGARCQVAALGELKKSGVETIGMTTNGIVLKRKLGALTAGGLDAVNISLDTLELEKFARITRRNGFEKARLPRASERASERAPTVQIYHSNVR